MHTKVLLLAGSSAPERGALIIAETPPSPQLTHEVREALKNLPARQMHYLRLVAQGFLTKEIARELGVSPDRVNKVVATVCSRLGVKSRREAARLFVEWKSLTEVGPDDVPPTHWLASQPLPLAQSGDSGPDASVINNAEAPDAKGRSLVEGQRFYDLPREMPDLLALAPLRDSGRLINDLTLKSTLIAIARLAAGALITVGSAVSLLSGLNTFVRH